MCKGCGAALEINSRKQTIQCPYRGQVTFLERKELSENDLICPACGAANKNHYEHCVQCGENLYRTCPKCGTRNDGDAVHCAKCGIPLDAQASKAKIAPQESQNNPATKKAKSALTPAIFGLFIFPIILEPIAIHNARKAKRELLPNDAGYKDASTAEWIGYISFILGIFYLLFLVNQIN
ncbi:MAG: hypothetical protein C4545_09985 [Anaerolineaceae bacterium]|nr:MAG: hypothetical protein C4545_09985 [Anaerolineaceae bacterium]